MFLASQIWKPLFYFSIVDSFLTFTSPGFYHDSLKFDLNSTYSHIFSYNGYNFLTSGFDFMIFFLLRYGLLAFFYYRKFYLSYLVLSGIQITNSGFTILKFIAFSEVDGQLWYPGAWVSCLWNFWSMLGVLLIWRWMQEKMGIEAPKKPKKAKDDDDEEEEKERECEKISNWKIGCRIFKFCLFQWKLYVIEFLIFMVATGIECLQPHYNAKLISIFANKESILNFIETLKNQEAMNLLIYTFIIAVMLYIVSMFLDGIKDGLSQYSGDIFENRLQSELYKSIMKQDLSFFEDYKTGNLMSRFQRNIYYIQHATKISYVLGEVVPMLYYLYFMSLISWRLTLLNFVALPFIGFAYEIYQQKHNEYWEESWKTETKASNVIEESISSIRTVKAFGCEDFEFKRYRKMLEESMKLTKGKSTSSMIYSWAYSISDNLNYIFIVIYAIYLVMNEKILPEHLVEFWLYESSFNGYIKNINWTIRTVNEGIRSAKKVFSIIDREPKTVKSGDLKKSIEGKIEFKDVCFTYPSRPNEKVLDNLLFVCQPDETIAFVGPSGAGKTTIIQLLKRLYDPSSGEILVDGVPIDEYDSRFLHNSIALVAQEPTLFDASISYNIKYGCDDWVTDEDVINAAKQAEIHEFISKTEKGYETKCGEKGVSLSGGQKQRIAIARAIIRKPRILILDEATSALDAATEREIQDTLYKISQHITVIIIAHRLSTVQRADKIFVLSEKKIVQSGNHHELMKDPHGVYYGLVSKQILHDKDNKAADDDTTGFHAIL